MYRNANNCLIKTILCYQFKVLPSKHTNCSKNVLVFEPYVNQCNSYNSLFRHVIKPLQTRIQGGKTGNCRYRDCQKHLTAPITF